MCVSNQWAAWHAHTALKTLGPSLTSASRAALLSSMLLLPLLLISWLPCVVVACVCVFNRNESLEGVWAIDGVTSAARPRTKRVGAGMGSSVASWLVWGGHGRAAMYIQSK